MPIEKSAGAVIFREDGDKIFYLLLHYPSSAKASKEYWDFPKGHIEKGENLEETAKREVEEETGLKDLKLIEGFKEWIKYFFKLTLRQNHQFGTGREGKNVFKIVTFFLAETKTKEVKVSFEHIGFKWLPYEEAIEKLTFKNAKEILKKANDFISKKSL